MWSAGELEELRGWVDGWRARGLALGELVATQLALRDDPRRRDARALRRRVRALADQLPCAPLRAFARGRRELLATWSLNLLVALRIDDHRGALGELAVTFTPREVLETLLQEQLGSHALLEPLIARRDASPLPTVDALLELRGRASTPTSSINSRPSSPPTPELP